MNDPTFFGPSYNRRWKAMSLRLSGPRGLRQWFWAVWGLDIWFGSVPLLKVIVAVNVSIWIAWAVLAWK